MPKGRIINSCTVDFQTLYMLIMETQVSKLTPRSISNGTRSYIVKVPKSIFICHNKPGPFWICNMGKGRPLQAPSRSFLNQGTMSVSMWPGHTPQRCPSLFSSAINEPGLFRICNMGKPRPLSTPSRSFSYWI